MSASATVVRSVPPAKNQRNPISRQQVESVISRSVAIFGLVFGAQTIPPFLAQFPDSPHVWAGTVAAALAVALVACFVASLAKRFVRTSHAIVSILYILALQSWPLAQTGAVPQTEENYWLYYLLTVATATAAIGFTRAIATTYLFVVPLMYGLIRLSPAGGSATIDQSVLDSIYAIILGGAIMIIVTMLRQASGSVDAAQAAALESYAFAVRQHATEVERVEVDSIVHDSVLTTFISAARAYTPEAKALAATMAGNAIGHLREAALVTPDDGSTVPLGNVARRIAEAANTIGAQFEVRSRSIGTRSMPIGAAEAVYSASVQAMVNSLQHAGAGEQVTRWLTIRGLSPVGLEVEVGDDGSGFAFGDVPKERIGLRVSIIDRVANAGGTATISSTIGEGTVIRILWPDPDRDQGDEPGATE